MKDIDVTSTLIDDTKDIKPDDWKEDIPLTISDPSKREPKTWYEPLDGPWEAPQVILKPVSRLKIQNVLIEDVESGFKRK